VVESTVLAVWLDAALNDQGAEADRTELVRGCPNFFAGDGGRMLVAWLHRSVGFLAEDRTQSAPSENSST
jgi:hypothetical protein